MHSYRRPHRDDHLSQFGKEEKKTRLITPSLLHNSTLMLAALGF